MILRIFRFRLYPSKAQIRNLEQTLEDCRYVYNILLANHKRTYEETGKTLSEYDMNLALKPLKAKCPILFNVHSQVLQNVSKRIKDAYHNFLARKKLGLKAGLPRFKKYGRYKSITYPQSGFKIERKKLYLSKIGSVNIKLHRSIKGVVKILTVKRMPSGKWFASFSCKVKEQPMKKPIKDVGIDVGLTSFAVLSDGNRIKNPRHYRETEKKLSRLQRQLSRKKKGSHNRNKAKVKVARLCEKIRNRRIDFLHKASDQIANNYEIVYVEDLQIRNMVKNHCLAKSISDASWGKFMQMIAYKEEESGGQLIKVNPRNTTQLCSQCGEIVEKNLSQRIHDCPHCGLKMDRDLNASKNILRIGQELPKYTPERKLTSTSSQERERGKFDLMNQEAFLLVER